MPTIAFVRAFVWQVERVRSYRITRLLYNYSLWCEVRRDGGTIRLAAFRCCTAQKGREFNVVIMFGAEEGGLPRNNATENNVREDRHLPLFVNDVSTSAISRRSTAHCPPSAPVAQNQGCKLRSVLASS